MVSNIYQQSDLRTIQEEFHLLLLNEFQSLELKLDVLLDHHPFEDLVIVGGPNLLKFNFRSQLVKLNSRKIIRFVKLYKLNQKKSNQLFNYLIRSQRLLFLLTDESKRPSIKKSIIFSMFKFLPITNMKKSILSIKKPSTVDTIFIHRLFR